ncbi:hypothetical protein AVEN_220098-1 [Araneus ventricosus]|uniref:Uncharacterized protein n=1 Tax=Araneus ventricosus TaxID=182803 RepID=A0A4Y2J5I3_ARAVE|nr:hypothetical protein AVEN_220098-1 [Araneus ventricosus]
MGDSFRVVSPCKIYSGIEFYDFFREGKVAVASAENFFPTNFAKVVSWRLFSSPYSFFLSFSVAYFAAFGSLSSSGELFSCRYGNSRTSKEPIQVENAHFRKEMRKYLDVISFYIKLEDLRPSETGF